MLLISFVHLVFLLDLAVVRSCSRVDLVLFILLVVFSSWSSFVILGILFFRFLFPILILLWGLFSFTFAVFHNDCRRIIYLLCQIVELISEEVMLDEEQMTVFYLLLPLHVR